MTYNLAQEELEQIQFKFQNISYKCRSGGTEDFEVNRKFSTMICSNRGIGNGSIGLDKLAVRNWKCGSGAAYDRDQNVTINAFSSGAGYALKESRNGLN